MSTKAGADPIDGFSSFVFNHIGADKIGFSARFDNGSGTVEAPNLSSGTLSLIGWLTLLSSQERQSITMIEEPEMGLTPRGVASVYAAIRESVGDGQNGQLLIATHSANLLAAAIQDFGDKYVYVTRSASGRASVEAASTFFADEDSVTPPKLNPVNPTRAMQVEQANQLMDSF